MDDLPLLHRARSFAVVDKPSGLPVEADSEESVVAQLSRQLAPSGSGRAWPRVVHRLDRDTSGCLAVALNDAAAEAFERAFALGAVKKEYAALVLGSPPAEGALDTSYGPDPRDRRRFTGRVQTPRRARLRFAVAEQLAGAALLRVWLETGRTHQIRVQLSEAGHPVLGDAVYGQQTLSLSRGCGLSRQALHAARLSFPSPEDGSPVACQAPLPGDLAAALLALRGATRGPPTATAR